MNHKDTKAQGSMWKGVAIFGIWAGVAGVAFGDPGGVAGFAALVALIATFIVAMA